MKDVRKSSRVVAVRLMLAYLLIAAGLPAGKVHAQEATFSAANLGNMYNTGMQSFNQGNWLVAQSALSTYIWIYRNIYSGPAATPETTAFVNEVDAAVRYAESQLVNRSSLESCQADLERARSGGTSSSSSAIKSRPPRLRPVPPIR